MLKASYEWGVYCSGYNNDRNPPTWEGSLPFFWQTFLPFTMFNRGFYPVVDIWRERWGNDFTSTMAIYDGHANRVKNQWQMCVSKNTWQPVQDFVTEYDGRAMIILLLCCNPRNKGRVTSQESLVIYSRGSMSLESMTNRRSRQLIHVPRHGNFVGTDDEKRLEKIAAKLGYKPSFV